MPSGLGAFGESWAVGHLTRLGYEIVERNVRYRRGEIDIVARQGADWVFVEVKTRRTQAYGSPEESITSSRYRRLASAVAEYVQEHGLEEAAYRIDLVSVCVDRGGRVSRGDVIQGIGPPVH